MSKFLASVKNKSEAEMVYAAGVDIIDLKDPARGALGALPISEIKTIAGRMKSRTTISATIGDLPADPGIVLPVVETIMKSGVNIIKIGFFPGKQHALATALARHACKQKLVAVLFADQKPDIRLLKTLSTSHFYGVMLDTAEKNGKGLLGYMTITEVEKFIRLSHQLHLRCGLAGQLRQADIPALLSLQPDYLGFRSALCAGNRTGELSLNSLQQIRKVIPQGQQENDINQLIA